MHSQTTKDNLVNIDFNKIKKPTGYLDKAIGKINAAFNSVLYGVR
jgi:hypothetical protein